MKKNLKNNPRLAAVQTLAKVLDKNLNLSEGDASAQLPDSRDRALARHLSYGVLRWLTSLQWLSRQLMDRPLKNRDQDIHRLVLIGLHQLWQDGTAQHAAIHETAECARLLGKSWAVGLVNAVLRRFQREQDKWLAALQQRPERFAHPVWLLQQLQSDWPDHWHEIAEANNHAAPLWLRINRSHENHQGIGPQLESAGFSISSHPHAQDALCIMPAASVGDIPGFQEGILSVQDPAAQLAVDQMKLEPRQRVLDACAAPGGKTCHMLERFPSLELTAVELSEARLELIKENVDRLGFGELESLKLISGDVADTGDWWDGQPFDRVLLDAPCTATGVIRRHPEIKWLRSKEQREEVLSLQARLLSQLWPLLKPGGILVYATCSVLIKENSGQIETFLDRQDDAHAVALDVAWGRESGVGRQILPGEDGMDGFFYACIQKNS